MNLTEMLSAGTASIYDPVHKFQQWFLFFNLIECFVF